jgi:hypothetical protein
VVLLQCRRDCRNDIAVHIATAQRMGMAQYRAEPSLRVGWHP